jgi:PIN domain nuclease of toxin-antitoxin system
MTYLLDTHVVLWWLFGDRKLSPVAKRVIGERENRVLVSAVSAWEISTKHRLGKLAGADVLLRDLPGWMTKAGFEELPISVRHAQKAGGWANAHRDPFDRMLAAQSVLEEAPLVTSDRALRTFGVSLVW